MSKGWRAVAFDAALWRSTGDDGPRGVDVRQLFRNARGGYNEEEEGEAQHGGLPREVLQLRMHQRLQAMPDMALLLKGSQHAKQPSHHL